MVQEGALAIEKDTYREPKELSAVTNDVDTLCASDSLYEKPEPVYGIVLTPPEAPEAAPRRLGGNEGVSFILGSLFLIFLVIALRFRNNYRYVLTMLRSLVETKTRHNVFDDTVSETSLIVLLNILWCACAGVIGFGVFRYLNPSWDVWYHRAEGMLLGMAVAAVYILFLWIAYSIAGWIFSDRQHAVLWIKGFTSSQALMAPAFFVTALIGICRPDTSLNVGIVSAVVFIIVKFIFIWKGYRIFFNQFSSWVLFLCYLCSLEIVPLILCYRCAALLGKIF